MSILDRAEKLAGMRELLDFLEAHSVIPLGIVTENGYTCYPQNGKNGATSAALAELRAIGEAIGAELAVPYGRHVLVHGPVFRGGVRFDAIVCDAEDLFKQQEAAGCVCCTYDCGDRRGHVRNDRDGGDLCNCGRDWPCEKASA